MRQTEAMIRIAILLLLLCVCLIGGKAFGQNCSIENVTEPDGKTVRWRLYVQEKGQEKHIYAMYPKRWGAFKECEHWLRSLEKQEKKAAKKKKHEEVKDAVHSSAK